MIESLERRRLLSASGIHVQLAAAPAFVAKQPDSLSVNVTHDPSVEVSNVATVTWGDGSAKQVVSVYTADPARATAVTAHAYAKPGLYRAKLDFFQGNHVVTRFVRPIRVTQTSPDGLLLHAKTGETLNAVVATYHSATPIQRAVVDFGDGTQGLGVATQTADGTYQITASHTYWKPGVYAVTVHGNDYLIPPGVHSESAIQPPIDAFSSIRVSGPKVIPIIPRAQLAATAPSKITSGDFPTMATASGLPDARYNYLYAVVNWSDGENIVGVVTINDDGTGTIQSNCPSSTVPTRMTYTLNLFLFDHPDSAQNTLLGSVTGSADVDPGPSPGFAGGIRVTAYGV